MKAKVHAQVGFAADDAGQGVAYVRLSLDESGRILRVPFTVRRCAGLNGREVGYAALSAVGVVLQRRTIERVRIHVDDDQLVTDLHEHREVPAPLVLSYVRLRCTLNQFKDYDIVLEATRDSDVTMRARSEAAMHVAA